MIIKLNNRRDLLSFNNKVRVWLKIVYCSGIRQIHFQRRCIVVVI